MELSLGVRARFGVAVLWATLLFSGHSLAQPVHPDLNCRGVGFGGAGVRFQGVTGLGFSHFSWSVYGPVCGSWNHGCGPLLRQWGGPPPHPWYRAWRPPGTVCAGEWAGTFGRPFFRVPFYRAWCSPWLGHSVAITPGLGWNPGHRRVLPSQVHSIAGFTNLGATAPLHSPANFTDGTITPVVVGAPPMNTMQTVLRQQQAAMRRRALESAESKQERAETFFKRGQRAEQEGNLAMARANYQRAFAAAQGELRLEIYHRMRARGWKR